MWIASVGLGAVIVVLVPFPFPFPSTFPLAIIFTFTFIVSFTCVEREGAPPVKRVRIWFRERLWGRV